MDINNEQLKKLFDALMETPLKSIVEIFLSGNFIDSNDEILDADEVIDNLRDFEKALYTAYRVAETERENIDARIKDLPKQSTSVRTDYVNTIEQRLDEIHESSNILEMCATNFWVCVSKRLRIFGNMQIRRNWTVVRDKYTVEITGFHDRDDELTETNDGCCDGNIILD
jgi:hypothetical protein